MKTPEGLRWVLQDQGRAALRARRGLRLLFVTAILAAIFWVVPADKVAVAVRDADLRFLAAGVLFAFPSAYLSASQLRILIHWQGIPFSAGQVMAINLGVKFYTLFVPSFMVAGGLRLFKLSRHTGKFAEALAALSFFRLIEISLTIVTGLCFWALTERSYPFASVLLLVVLVTANSLALLVLTRIGPRLGAWIGSVAVSRTLNPSWQRVVGQAQRLARAIGVYGTLPARDVLLVTGTGIAQQLVIILSNQVIAQAVGISISFFDMGWVYCVVNLSTQVLFSFAGGLGVREVTVLALLSTLGVQPERALAFSFLLFGRGLTLSLVGGVLEAVGSVQARMDQ